MFHLPIPINRNSGEPLDVIKRVSRGYEYNILKYNLASHNGDKNTEYALITNSDKTKVFAYMAPPQTIDYSEFCDSCQTDDRIEIKYSIEGTMITFFWNDDTEEWDICTRNISGD